MLEKIYVDGLSMLDNDIFRDYLAVTSTLCLVACQAFSNDIWDEIIRNKDNLHPKYNIYLDYYQSLYKLLFKNHESTSEFLKFVDNFEKSSEYQIVESLVESVQETWKSYEEQ